MTDASPSVELAAVELAAVELAAIERGAGPAVTLVHGGVFHSGPAWARTIGALVQSDYRVIAVDRRGYGRSPPGDGWAKSVSAACNSCSLDNIVEGSCAFVMISSCEIIPS